MLLTVIAILVLLWLVGVFAHVAGGFIHTLLVVAAIIFVYDVLIKRRRK